MLSMTTDFLTSTGDPVPDLQRIAQAGFTHVHWCHQWNTDYLYSAAEQQRIATCLQRLGLSLLDLHGSAGIDANWASPVRQQRLAGIELVINRIEMTARLGGAAVIMHATIDGNLPSFESAMASLFESLDTLAPCAQRLGVRIAIENGLWPPIHAILDAYSPDYIGLCYDSGHGNVSGNGLAQLDALKDRLISIHLHDNDGTADQHRLPLGGTVDWPTLADILSRSAYTGCVSLESNMSHETETSPEAYLAHAFVTASRIDSMINACKGKRHSAQR